MMTMKPTITQIVAVVWGHSSFMTIGTALDMAGGRLTMTSSGDGKVLNTVMLVAFPNQEATPLKKTTAK